MLSSRSGGAKSLNNTRAQSPTSKKATWPDDEESQVSTIRTLSNRLKNKYDVLDKKDCGPAENRRLDEIVKTFVAADKLLTVYSFNTSLIEQGRPPISEKAWNSKQAEKVFERLQTASKFAHVMRKERADCPEKSATLQQREEEKEQMVKQNRQSIKKQMNAQRRQSASSAKSTPVREEDVDPRFHVKTPVRRNSLLRLVAAMRRSSPFS